MAMDAGIAYCKVDQYCMYVGEDESKKLVFKQRLKQNIAMVRRSERYTNYTHLHNMIKHIVQVALAGR